MKPAAGSLSGWSELETPHRTTPRGPPSANARLPIAVFASGPRHGVMSGVLPLWK